ncbi:hypothetical protein ABW21_db0206460 [Orbilia brochopaga]|nr:hypothetical protein ABW21_db0206460 [Drechslerella brochopaga]
MSKEALKELTRDTWEDTLAWAKLQTLLGVHKKMVRKLQRDLETLVKDIKPSSSLKLGIYKDMLDEFEELERQFSEDLPKRGQSTSDMIFNLMSVANAEAAEAYSISIGRIQWVSFIFLPLITISGFFGMNVDILANNPPFAWYFVIAVPFLILVLVITLTFQHIVSFACMTKEYLGEVWDRLRSRRTTDDTRKESV